MQFVHNYYQLQITLKVIQRESYSSLLITQISARIPSDFISGQRWGGPEMELALIGRSSNVEHKSGSECAREVRAVLRVEGESTVAIVRLVPKEDAKLHALTYVSHLTASFFKDSQRITSDAH